MFSEFIQKVCIRFSCDVCETRYCRVSSFDSWYKMTERIKDALDINLNAVQTTASELYVKENVLKGVVVICANPHTLEERFYSHTHLKKVATKYGYFSTQEERDFYYKLHATSQFPLPREIVNIIRYNIKLASVLDGGMACVVLQKQWIQAPKKR